MALPKIFTHNGTMSAGVTLIEILLVMGILAIVSGLALVTTFDSLRAYGFKHERDILVVLLQKARSQATSGVCLGALCVGGKQHGVSVQSSRYVVFEGSSYATRDVSVDEYIAVNYPVSASGLSEVVFVELSGDAIPSSLGSITLSDSAGHTSRIDINSEGRIAWTN